MNALLLGQSVTCLCLADHDWSVVSYAVITWALAYSSGDTFPQEGKMATGHECFQAIKLTQFMW